MFQRTLPSGLVIEFEDLGVEAEDLIAVAQESPNPRDRELIDERIMSLAWQRTITPGPTPCAPDGRPIWDKLLLGDKQDFMNQIIIESWGGEMALRVKCPQNHSETHHLNLANLAVQAITPEVARAVKTQTPLTLRLPRCGRTVSWLPVTVERARQVMQDAEDFPGQSSTNSLISRIIDIEGFDPEKHLDPETNWDIREFVRHLKGKDSVALRAEFERLECGVDTIANSSCPKSGCGAPVVINLGEAVPDFFAMRKAVKH